MPNTKAPATKTKTMADGCKDISGKTVCFVRSLLICVAVNEARAMRVAEVMNDYQILQRYIMQPQPSPSREDYYEEGYEVIRQCREAAQAILSVQYDYEFQQVPSGPGESEKLQLQR